MADQQDVRRIALGMPEATEDPDTFHFRVRDKGFVWVFPERVHPKRPRVPNPEVIVVCVADLAEKEALLASDATMFFTTPHYNGFKAVMVRLPAVGESRLVELITDAWRSQAPPDLAR